ncbi:nucleotidyltransferase domain-containing protein [Clostridium sp. Marseille-P2415]|uniref:nucleotidyltransferase domain-containing protein n=1 Tax=Clostridium sp. Marseille-P2415 TaxID=1805471 RepID=UPI0009883AD1|nr:nucleotidyltransferase domain-containing protein [Clostridium sp. Marseille-P2415]
MAVDNAAKDKAMSHLYELLDLQKEVESQFGETGYNVFVFGSYLTTQYVEGVSDIDIAIYAEDFDLYKKLSLYLEEHFDKKGIKSDIFFIDLMIEAPIYCAPLKSRVQFTDYFPKELEAFEKKCRLKLEEAKARIAV